MAAVPVTPGTTEWSLAQQNGVSVSAIEAANPGVSPTDLQVGSTLNVPTSGGNYSAPVEQPQQPSYEPPAQPSTYSSPSQTSSVPGSMSCIVQRESGGNPTAVNPVSGAGGLYQDLPSTWNGYDGYPNAQSAPVSVQNQFNQQLAASQGLSPWASDGCPGT